VARKFILIDQSIASVAGHHYEYAVHVLEAAERAGYAPLLATHVRFGKKKGEAKTAFTAGWTIHPLYRYGFWAAQETPRFAPLLWLRKIAGDARFRWKVWFRYSPLGLAWQVRTRFGEFLMKQPADRPHLLSLATLIPSVIALKLIRLAALLLLLPAMLAVFVGRSVTRLFEAGGFPQSYLRSLLADARDFLRLNQLIYERRAQFLNWLQQYRCIQSFAADSRRLLEDLELTEEDVIYLPTVSAIELMGLARLLEGSPGARRPAWHLMFRRDIYRGRPGDYPAQEGRINDLRQVFENCAAKLRRAGARVSFYTDTDELTEQYNRLGAFRFRTAPIPHTHAVRAGKPRAGPLRVIYVGDARGEKGYHHIPGIIRSLWAEYVETGKATFHLQSNYNIPQGEPEAVVARSALEALPKDKVELFKRPMTSAEYRDFLLSGDINLLLYDATNYYARSSGILVESLSAGVPVIVPAGSWLARQFLGPYQRRQAALKEAMRVLKSYTAGDLRWSVHGNPRANARARGEITATAQGKAFAWVRAPAGATHVLVTLRFGAGPQEAYVYVDQVDARGHELSEGRRLLVEAWPPRDGEDRKAVCLLATHPKTAKLWLAIGSLYAYASVAVTAVEVDFLAPREAAAPPTGAVGLIYHDLGEVPGLLGEMIDHYPHYRATAAEFARECYAYHNADRLIEELVEAPAGGGVEAEMAGAAIVRGTGAR